MNDPDRQRVARAFARAGRYDGHAHVQLRVATGLAREIARLPLPPSPRVLEIGCGTGFLTRALADEGLGGEWLVTDLAPAMVERCRRRMAGRPGLRYAVLDGERDRPGEAGRFDLVCSSLALQWFDDPAGAVGRMLGWLAPGGRLALTTLGAATFAEWRAAHRAEGLADALRPLPPASAWAAISPDLQAGPPRVERIVERHADGLAFPRMLRAIGASTPGAGLRPLGPGALRRVARRFEAGGATVSYEVVTCHYARP